MCNILYYACKENTDLLYAVVDEYIYERTDEELDKLTEELKKSHPDLFM